MAEARRLNGTDFSGARPPMDHPRRRRPSTATQPLNRATPAAQPPRPRWQGCFAAPTSRRPNHRAAKHPRQPRRHATQPNATRLTGPEQHPGATRPKRLPTSICGTPACTEPPPHQGAAVAANTPSASRSGAVARSPRRGSPCGNPGITGLPPPDLGREPAARPLLHVGRSLREPPVSCWSCRTSSSPTWLTWSPQPHRQGQPPVQQPTDQRGSSFQICGDNRLHVHCCTFAPACAEPPATSRQFPLALRKLQ
ncbi:hypothetical protein EV186_103817 [Labedaea rhizosphaerae]|uniref:Uncharacterized protein n=1 Tax=Labedaea rhizosphaerae TaxID=598644 RepID=A0A4R6SD28_LABRH|nr:hypothetical protein EV186_103817 [Labedaea rhizosphaerae]